MTATLDAPQRPRLRCGSTSGASKLGDKIFGGLSKGAGILILVTLAAVAVFLLTEAFPTFTSDDATSTFLQYVGPLVFGTIWAAFLALVIATPLAVAVALFTSHYAPRRLRRTARLLHRPARRGARASCTASGASGVFAPVLARSVYPWLEDNLGFIPLFKGPASTSGRTMMTVAVVLAVMILPIITAISREVFLQTPRLHEEASLALGATRWEMIRQAVIPYGRSGVISGAMLGLGRALGETMAVAIILSPADIISFNIISNQNPNTIAANIALKFPESSGIEVNRLIATGLVLFVLTFGVNVVARRIARAGFSGADG